MNDLVSIFLKSMLIDNVVLIQFLALCPFIGMTSDTGKATGMGIATSFVMILATVVTYPLYHLAKNLTHHHIRRECLILLVQTLKSVK